MHVTFHAGQHLCHHEIQVSEDGADQDEEEEDEVRPQLAETGWCHFHLFWLRWRNLLPKDQE